MTRIFKLAKRTHALLRDFPKLRQRLDGIGVEFHYLQENCDFDIDTNGEVWILRTLANHSLLKTVFDVGANHGDWTAKVLEMNPGAVVHCFEICPPTFQKLSKNLATRNAQIILNSFGLSDIATEIEIKYSPDDDGKTSMFDVLLPLKVEVAKAKVITGKEYCAGKSIQSFDFLKIDVEGAEHLVLKGFGDVLKPENLPVVQ